LGVVVLASLVVAWVGGPGSGTANADFAIDKDAFSISNAPGWCFAMAAFSRWYYLTNNRGPALRDAIDQEAQQRIARELQTFYSRNLVTVQANYCNRFHGNESDCVKRLFQGLTVGEPRLVLLMNKGLRGAILHAVLAYGCDQERGILKIYDPNYCDQERIIELHKKEYTSLDITYNAICFPEVLHDNTALLRKMEALYAAYAAKAPAPTPRVVHMRAQ
jgi:hypothetical protein